MVVRYCKNEASQTADIPQPEQETREIHTSFFLLEIEIELFDGSKKAIQPLYSRVELSVRLELSLGDVAFPTQPSELIATAQSSQGARDDINDLQIEYASKMHPISKMDFAEVLSSIEHHFDDRRAFQDIK